MIAGSTDPKHQKVPDPRDDAGPGGASTDGWVVRKHHASLGVAAIAFGASV